MKWDPEVRLAPRDWLLAFVFVLSTIVFGIMGLWAFVLMLQWFVRFWYPCW